MNGVFGFTINYEWKKLTNQTTKILTNQYLLFVPFILKDVDFLLIVFNILFNIGIHLLPKNMIFSKAKEML